MNKFLLTLSLSVALSGGLAAQASTFKKVDFETYTQSLSKKLTERPRQWQHTGKQLAPAGKQRIITEAEAVTPATSYWGSLTTPKGEEWLYTMDYTYSDINEYQTTINSALITIYDSNFNVYKKLTAEFELQGNETSINSVQISPTLTRKFFNINDDYEIMVMVHATTEDYTGHLYTQVYTLSDGSLVTCIEGDNIGAINTAADEWAEKYTILFMREENVITDDDFKYYLHFDVYSKADWGTGCKLEHTFDVDYEYFAGAGNRALPILMNSVDNHIYYALPRYEKPYFASDFGDDVTPDNHFIIDLYDEEFNLVKTTSIPMETEENALFSFPGMGELRGNLDMSFDLDGKRTEYPTYVIGVENYVISVDDYVTSLYLYDADGNKLKTIVEDAYDYLYMSDVPGQQDQFCFLFVDEVEAWFKFIDVPSYELVAEMPLYLDGTTISTAIDRTPSGSSYKYASSILTADVDEQENTIHKIAWFNADGTFDRIDRINLGKSVSMAQVNILGEALNPYLFNTDDNMEYMFLVKRYNNANESTSKEYFIIYNDESEKLLEIGQNDETGARLNSIFLMNLSKINPKLIVTYYQNDDYTLHSLDLPLEKFANGEGTAESPYLIATAGDLRAIQSAPNAYYELADDIDANNIPWVGNAGTFTGVLDGKGHTISNLCINGSGMFNTISVEGQVKNLNIKGVKMNVARGGGIITGYLEGNDEKHKAAITNVHITDAVISGDGDVLVGGIAGSTALYAVIEDCSVTDTHINLGRMSQAGGIVGSMYTSSKVINTLFDGWITGGEVGGIAGFTATGDENITDCHAHVEIVGQNVAGGIIGDSGRSIVTNCFVDGNIYAAGSNAAFSGGIVGTLKSTYEAPKAMVIKDCIVAANVSSNPEAQSSISHAIAGFTSGDEMLVDWESSDPSIDWSDPSTYPYINGEPEKALRGNIAVLLDPEATPVNKEPSSPDGQEITLEQLTDEMLALHDWKMGTVWQRAATALALVSEDFTLTAEPEQLSVSIVADSVDELIYQIEFACASRYAHLMSVECSDANVAQLSEPTLSADGKTIVCEVTIKCEGSCTVTATLDENKATCDVKAEIASIADVISDKGAIVYDGKTITCAGCDITVYDVLGKAVAKGYDSLSTSSLPKGVYVVSNGKQSLKIMK